MSANDEQTRSINLNAVETAQARGRRDAAQRQHDAANPYDFKTQPEEHNAWNMAAAGVHASRTIGRDLGGHSSRPPQLCAVNLSKICNCCSECRRECAVEAGIEEPPKPAPNMLNRAAWALVRIAVALEAQSIRAGISSRNTACSTCGTFIGKPQESCPICGVV